MRHITLSEYLRPWSQAGISHFLADPDVLWQDMAEEEVVRDAVNPAIKRIDTLKDDSFRTHNNPGLQHTRTAPSVSPPSRKPSPDPSETISTGYVSPAAPSVDESLVTDEWRALLAKTPAAPVLWSYEELGLDLGGRGSSERSVCLRTIIGRLALPKGSSTFWPYSLPDAEGRILINLHAYHFGLSRLRPSVIVLLGIDSVVSVSPLLSLHIPFTQQVYEGRLHILLPDFTQLQANSSLLDSACTYLRSALSTLSALRL